MGHTLLDIAKLNNDDGVVDIIEEVIRVSPEMTDLPADTIPGQSFDTVVCVSDPSVGFRNANEGAATVKPTWENRLVQTAILDASVEEDEAVIDAYKKGRDAFFAKNAKLLLKAGFHSCGSQFYYGTDTTVATSAATSPTKGFTGAIEAVDSSKVIDATGTGTTRSSAWFVRKGGEYVQWIFGKNGELDTEDPRRVRLTDGSGKPYDGWRLPLKAYIGAQFINPKNSLIRIKNLTDSKGLTDDLLSQAWALVDDDAKDEWVIFMTKRSLSQLQRSRTATNAIGAPAPWPTDWEGIPIKVTTSISNAEAA